MKPHTDPNRTAGFLAGGAMAMGLMVSPDNLTLLGRLAGYSGNSAWIWVAAGAAIHMIHAGQEWISKDVPGGAPLENRGFGSGAGSVPAVALQLGSRWAAAVFIPTGILVSAGFAFNEVFLYWFPNFAFAFLVLGLVLVLHLFGWPAVWIAQAGSVGIVLGGLIVLIAAGLAGPLQPGSPGSPDGDSVRIAMEGAFLPLLLFIGYDSVQYAKNTATGGKVSPFPAMAAAIGCAAVLFGPWATISAGVVSPERLTGTTIPHLLASKAILGTFGRFLMAAMIIAGAFAAVNMLFHTVSGTMSDLARQRLAPAFLEREWITYLVLAGAIGTAMGTGLAGSGNLETYIRAGLCMWLVRYAVTALCTGVSALPGKRDPRSAGGRWNIFLSLAGFTVTAGGIALLVRTDSQPVLLLTTVAAILLSAGLAEYGWLRWKKQRRQPWKR